MRETVITPGRKRRELRVFLACAIAAYILNIVGIIIYNSPAKELVTQLPLVALLTVILYVVVVIVRIVLYYISMIWSKEK